MSSDVPWDFVQNGTTLTSTESGLTWVGTIDATTGVFQIHADAHAVATVLLCGVIDATLAPAGDQFTGTFATAPLQCTGPPHFPTCECGSFSAPSPVTGTRLTSGACGNGTIENDEQCDDGNTQNGDCCSSTCTFEAAGAPCLDSELCTVDTCDGAGQCSHRPSEGCRTASEGSTISLRDDGAAGGRLRWTWKDATGQTSLADFGNPPTTAPYRLCVFAGDTLLFAGDAGASPSWRAVRNGFVYKNPDNPDGIRSVKLRAVGATATLLAKGKGPLLNFAAPLDAASVRVQLKRDGLTPCWESTFDQPKISQPDRFVARE
jgi:cysteine-rich repeat protein